MSASDDIQNQHDLDEIVDPKDKLKTPTDKGDDETEGAEVIDIDKKGKPIEDEIEKQEKPK